jgi:AraC family transcriptional regulator
MVDIAFSCGFSDQAHFSRVFKKIEGLTPKQYRKKD